MSTHAIKVVPLPPIVKHPNADTLGLVDFDGWQCIVKSEEWRKGEPCVYIPPDYCVDTTRPEFSFHASRGHRVKAIRLRKEWSEGLVVKPPPNAKVGDDVMKTLGIWRYEPPIKGQPNPTNKRPPTWWERWFGWLWKRRPYGPKGLTLKVYDIEHLQGNTRFMTDGEPVWVTEKIHGANARYVWWKGKLWIGSRQRWLKHGGDKGFYKAGADSVWHEALTPAMENWCRANPGMVLFGEVYGRVQDLTYGLPNGVAFRAFDVYDSQARTFWDWSIAARSLDAAGVQLVPVYYNGPYKFETAQVFAEGRSAIPKADNIREGVVVRPVAERRSPGCGRVIFKVVSRQYLERA